MRKHPRKRALIVVATSVIAVVAVTVAGTGAFGARHTAPKRSRVAAAGTAHFSSAPNKGQFGQLPNSMHAHTGTPCKGDKTVDVKLMQGTTTKSSVRGTVDAKGRWSVFMSIPSNLTPGTYAVTASCFASATPGPSDPVNVSYKPNSFKVVAPVCPGAGTTTTVVCRTTTTSTTTTTVHP
jgi:hypothetical protein